MYHQTADKGRGHRSSMLPTELVAKVLLHIDEKRRLLSCSLVSHTWNTAVKLTFRTLTCTLGASAEYEALSSWLRNNSNSSNIASINVDSRLSGYETDFAVLPELQLTYSKMHNLQTLRLQLCALQPIVTTADGHSTALQAAESACLSALTAITELRLDMCVADLSTLGRCTALQHLRLCFPSSASTSCNQDTAAANSAPTREAMLAVALPHLQHLTFLALNTQAENEGLLEFTLFSSGLSALQRLEVLELGRKVQITESSLASLPISLSRLAIESQWWNTLELSCQKTPRLSELTNLQQLELNAARGLQSELLLSYPQLTRLKLNDVVFADDVGQEEDQIAVLNVLQKLTQLEHLDLQESLRLWIYDLDPYAALTVSSHLTYLDLSSCWIDQGVLACILSPRCSSLKELHMNADQFYDDGVFKLLVICCPALRRLVISDHYDMEPGVIELEGLKELKDLTTLTSLHIYNVAFSDEALDDISQCQMLQDLKLAVTDVSTAGLTHLTQLTSLTSLDLQSYAGYMPGGLRLLNQAADGCPPDVHQQLLTLLDQGQVIAKREREVKAVLMHTVADPELSKAVPEQQS